MKTCWLLGTGLLLFAGCEFQPAASPVVFTTQLGTFVHEISARGTVVGNGEIEVRCQVNDASPDGTMILEIVPEGTSVKPGDLLVQLDISALQEELLQQQILCNGLEAELAAAVNEYEKAQLAEEEYLKGLYPEEEKATKDDLLASEQRLDHAQRKLEAAETDAKSAQGSAEDIDALRFDVEMAKRKVEAAKNRLSVLNKYTKPLRLRQLEGNVKAADALKRAKETEVSIQSNRLGKIEKQVAACTITAPSAGVVFYANVPGETEEDEILITAGAPVRLRQVILRIAQLDNLSVQIEVAESDIAHIQTDMPAIVWIDAMPDTPFDGRVANVHPYPTRETRGSTDKKKYEVRVAINKPSGTLRPGLTADVEMTVAELDNTIQIPCSAVFEENDTDYCLVHNRNRWSIRAVVTGPNDGTVIVIREGLDADEGVAIHPLQYRQQASQ